jgi:hypothetical protein
MFVSYGPNSGEVKVMVAHRRATALGLGALLLLAVSSRVDAVAVTGSVTDLGGGVFRYDLVVDNTGGSEPLSGLNILEANTLFGLDGSSVIGAPPDWDFSAPIPGFVDELNYLSLFESADVPVGGTLGGFFFETTTPPRKFSVDVIGADCDCQIPVGRVRGIPQPSSVLLLGGGVLGALGYWRMTRRPR